jgi:iron complex outermembrane receptor protein
LQPEGFSPRLRPAALLGALPLLAAGAGPAPESGPGATVEVTAPLPERPLVTVLDPRGPRQPVPAQDGAELLRTVPGFGLVRKGGTGGEPVLRGMAGSRLGVLADGEETPGGCGGRMDPPTAYIHPGAYDQVQVLKGPQTVRYGPGLAAGTVLFRRLPRRWERPGWSAAGSWTAGSFGRDDQVLEVQAGTPRYYGRGIGVRSHAVDYQAGDGRPVPSRYDRWSAHGALGWTPAAGVRAELRGSRADGRAAYADRGMDGVAFLRRNLALEMELQEPTPRVGRLEAMVYFNDVDHIMDNGTLRPFRPAPAQPGPMARNPRRTTRGARLEATLWAGSQDQWILGADLRDSRHDLRRTQDAWSVPVAALGRTPDAEQGSAGLWTEWTRVFPAGHRLAAGLRLDRWHARDLRARLPLGPGGMPNPTAQARREQLMAGLFVRGERRLEPSGTTVYLGLGQVQRPPDYWELIPLEAPGSPSAFRTRAERTTQLDAGALWEGERVRVSLAGFCGRTEDFILVQSNFAKASPSPAGGGRLATVVRNVRAATWGGELALEAALARSLRAEGSLACTWGENRTDRLPLGQVPPPEARLGLAWERPAWSAGALAHLVAPQDRVAPWQGGIAGQDLGPSPGFAVVSLNGGWNPAGAGSLSFRFGVDNLFDRAYCEHLGRMAGAVPGYPSPPLRVEEPGRLVWVSVGLKVP